MCCAIFVHYTSPSEGFFFLGRPVVVCFLGWERKVFLKTSVCSSNFEAFVMDVTRTVEARFTHETTGENCRNGYPSVMILVVCLNQ